MCKRLRGTRFTLMCVPCVQFLNQEVPENAKVHNFVVGKLKDSGGSFMVTEKMDVNGKRTHPMYLFLKATSVLYRPKTKKALPIPWNYGKFVVDPEGKVVSFKGPKFSPLAMEEFIRQYV